MLFFSWLMAILTTDVDLESKKDDVLINQTTQTCYILVFFLNIIFILTIFIFCVLPFTFLLREDLWKTIRCHSTHAIPSETALFPDVNAELMTRKISSLVKDIILPHQLESCSSTHTVSTGVRSSKYLHSKNTYMAWTHEAQVRKTFIIHEAIFNIKQEK